MIDHIGIWVADRGKAEGFYDAVLSTLGCTRDYTGEHYTEWGDFAVGQAGDGHLPISGLHIAFAASSREEVDTFHRAGLRAGARDDGRPGPRPEYVEDYYGGFLLDPDGNSAEAVHHQRSRGSGAIDHLWIRVADLAAAKRFYDTITPFAGLYPHTSRWGEQFRSQAGSFMLVHDGRPATRNLHMAFAASDNATVDAFHAAAMAAGYRDNGGPGERRLYHPGYYGAFVFDPDGNNIEVVCHNR